MNCFFLISYHGSTYNKLESSLNSHPKIQKLLKTEKNKIYFNSLDVENSKNKHKYIFGGSWYYDTCLENYEIASKNILQDYFFVYYFDEENEHNDNDYLNYRLRRIYEMIQNTKNYICFFNNNSNFDILLRNLENKLELETPLIEPREYKKIIMGNDECTKYKFYYDLIKTQHQSKILV